MTWTTTRSYVLFILFFCCFYFCFSQISSLQREPVGKLRSSCLFNLPILRVDNQTILHPHEQKLEKKKKKKRDQQEKKIEIKSQRAASLTLSKSNRCGVDAKKVLFFDRNKMKKKKKKKKNLLWLLSPFSCSRSHSG